MPQVRTADGLRQRWGEVVSRLSQDPPTRPVIQEAFPVDLDRDCVVIGIPSTKPWLAEAAVRRSGTIKAGISAVLGRELDIRVELVSPDWKPPTAAPPSPRSTAKSVTASHPRPPRSSASRGAVRPRSATASRPLSNRSTGRSLSAQDRDFMAALARRLADAEGVAAEMEKAPQPTARRTRGPSARGLRAVEEAREALRAQQAGATYYRRDVVERTPPPRTGSYPPPDDDWREQE